MHTIHNIRVSSFKIALRLRLSITYNTYSTYPYLTHLIMRKNLYCTEDTWSLPQLKSVHCHTQTYVQEQLLRWRRGTTTAHTVHTAHTAHTARTSRTAQHISEACWCCTHLPVEARGGKETGWTIGDRQYVLSVQSSLCIAAVAVGRGDGGDGAR